MAATLAEARALIEHAFELDAWHIDGQVFRAPQVRGRIVFGDGAITMMLRDESREGRAVTRTMLGYYEMDSAAFVNRYPTDFAFIEEGGTITADHDRTFQGKRTYHVETHPGGVRLVSRGDDRTTFHFTPQGMTITHGETPVRVWKREAR